jgi:endo-1,4-beta-mannosidase
MYIGHNSLKIFDYSLFAQESFVGWVKQMREAIRAAGAQQLITVGQDEGGFVDRLSPAFFSADLDFTTNHSWWQNDSLLWDSLVAKQPGKAMLIQETGLQRELNLDEIARYTTAAEASLIERKFALSLAQGSGAIEWLWNSNSYMTEGNETPIGAVRPDGTEKEEAAVLRDFAAFSKVLSPHLKNPRPPSIAIITSQAAQYSVLSGVQIAAQRNAVRTLAYSLHLMPYVVAENRIADLGSPKLAILPSPQVLTEPAWQSLLAYVRNGGSLLITGPVSRDEHMRLVNRTAPLKLDAATVPLASHSAQISLDDSAINLSFNQQAQFALVALHFFDAANFH